MGEEGDLPGSHPGARLPRHQDHAAVHSLRPACHAPRPRLRPFERFFIALVAVHALPGTTIRRLPLPALDLSAATLTTSSGLLPHVVLLEDLSHQLAADWLTERHRRWPAAINPHLVVSQQSALDTTHRVVSSSMFQGAFSRVGLTMQQVRQDRILYEARHSADPLHLMRLFGLSDSAAMRYITAAHPERTTKLPR
jgi:hypothetical protein